MARLYHVAETMSHQKVINPGPMLTRRTFLGQAALAAGAAVSVSRGAATASSMFVSLNASLTGPVPWPDFVRLAARLGYGGVDVNVNGARTQGLEATRALFAESKMAPAVASLPVRFTSGETEFQDDLKRLDET